MISAYRKYRIIHIYIPLCFYLYLSATTVFPGPIIIYIPLCFYLYSLSERIYTSLLIIYIPLCFYLYDTLPTTGQNVEHNLHSTMLLLIRIQHLIIFVRKINLHSTMLLLIPDRYFHRPSESIFTFHYASTYTIFCEIRHCIIKLFTFHYASTYTKTKIIFFFLYQLIYIPLCFYLYALPDG